jgi:hypothetical protein
MLGLLDESGMQSFRVPFMVSPLVGVNPVQALQRIAADACLDVWR